jgi:hypothetical protein
VGRRADGWAGGKAGRQAGGQAGRRALLSHAQFYEHWINSRYIHLNAVPLISLKKAKKQKRNFVKKIFEIFCGRLIATLPKSPHQISTKSLD